MATADDMLHAIAPELDSIDSTRRATVLAMATTRTPAGIYPDDQVTNQAIAYLAAFMLSQPGGTSAAKGPVISKSVGPLRIAYGSVSTSDSDLSSNSFGRQLLELRRSYIINPMTRSIPLPADDESL